MLRGDAELLGRSAGADMAEAVIGQLATGDGRRPTRRWPKIAALVAVVVLVVGGLCAFLQALRLDHQYGPIQSGMFYGRYSDRNFVNGDGLSYSLARAPGVTGQLLAEVDNLGTHSVTITSIDPDDIVTNIRWSTYRVENGGSVFGVNTAWHSFPATVPAHGTIRLLITIRHPDNCSAYPPGTRVTYSGLHTVHWDSLLHSHLTVIDDGLKGNDIGVC